MTTQTAIPTEVSEPQAPVVAESPQAEVEVAPASAPAAAPVAAPVAVAPAVPVPVIPAPPVAVAPPAIDSRQEYIAGLERTNRENQARLDQQNDVSAIATLSAELVANGLDPERAQAFATRQVQATRQGQVQVAEARAKFLYAGQLADQHKVSVASLMQYDTPDAMLQAVERIAGENTRASEIAALRAEVAALKKGQVPAQTFATAEGASGAVVTNDNIDAIFMEWEKAHPNQQNNPYTVRYRQALGM